MSKVFISSSLEDQKFAVKLADKLRRDGIIVLEYEKELSSSDNILRKPLDIINELDYFIVILSRNSLESKWVNDELAIARIAEIFSSKIIIIPILIEDIEIPFFLSNRLYLNFYSSFENGYPSLIKALRTKATLDYNETDRNINNFSKEQHGLQIDSLKEAYCSGKLVLFCGAGISYDAGIPDWNNLLNLLLKAVYSKIHDSDDIHIKLSNLLQKKLNLSPLIIAQYLKSSLKEDFTETVRDILYNKCNDKSMLVDAIARLCNHENKRKRIKAIVTFNFDDLIEKKLCKEKIKYHSIFSEGERLVDNVIPIYHPHGFLPRHGRITIKNDIVFSEDAYHTQFMDSFGWGNLVQLNCLNNSTCLLIGVSLTDPNLRRLLDVSMRKSGNDKKNHYTIIKRHSIDEIRQEKEIDGKQLDAKALDVYETFLEIDANKLGINVIWINQFNENVDVLNEIGK